MKDKFLEGCLNILNTGIRFGMNKMKDDKPETGCRDMNGVMIRLGDIVRYNLSSKYTKREYWNPEYEVIFDPPCFTLKHVGGRER